MKQNLNFDWKYKDTFNPDYISHGIKDGVSIDIPHTVKEVPYNYFNEKDYQIISSYEKVFDMEDDIVDKVIILRFDAFMLKARIYLNEEMLGFYQSGYVPVEIDVTGIVKQKGNRLLVVLDSSEDPDIPPFGYAVDYLTFSGIYREVSISTHPKTYIKDIFVYGDMSGNIKVSFTKVGDSKSFDFKNELYDMDGNLVSTFRGEENIKSPHLWSVDDPYLYTVKTIITSGDGTETYVTRTGFRSIKFTTTGFYLNDKKLKLRGLNRHQSYPIMGYAASKSLQEDDANLLKNMIGVNVVRTSHYPQSEHFLNRCDELGLLVINEIPGWQHIGESKKWREAYLEDVRLMVINERNHPCLIAHGVRIDESQDDHALYSEGNKLAHELDPYRPTIGVRNFTDSELLEDIYGYNDFSNWQFDSIGLMNPNKVKGAKNKPYLVTEYLGHMGPTKPTSDQFLKTDHCLRHLRVINDSNKYDRTCGAIGWCFSDYHTHADFGTGDHICPHGVLDINRNPKHAYAAYASQQDKFPVMEVISNMKPGELSGAIFSDIYVVTNCDYVELYKNDEFIGKFYPNTQKLFPNLEHPPILIDDIVGPTFKEDKIPEKYWKKIAKCYSYAAIHGFDNITFKMKVFLGFIMSRYKISYAQLVAWWNKYVGSWGGIAKFYKFIGYKDGKEVKQAVLGPSKTFRLEVKQSKLVLENKETYDSSRISLRYLDTNGELMQYASKVVHIEVSGPIRLVGDNYQSLLGGQLSIYINSLNKKGTGKIKITLEDIVKEIQIEVR